MRLLSSRKGYPNNKLLHSIAYQNFLITWADKFKSWRVPVDGRGVVLGAVLFGVFQADLQVAALFQQGEQVQFFSTQLVLQLRLLDPHVDVATAHTLSGLKLRSWQALHVYNPSAFWCPLNREENQEIPTALCHGIQEIGEPSRVGSFLQTDVCSVSSTCPAQQMVNLLILGTRADSGSFSNVLLRRGLKTCLCWCYCSLK